MQNYLIVTTNTQEVINVLQTFDNIQELTTAAGCLISLWTASNENSIDNFTSALPRGGLLGMLLLPQV